MLGAVSRCYQRVVLPQMGRVVLAAELGRSTADADTVPGFLERRHNRSAREQRASPDVGRRNTVATQRQVVQVCSYNSTFRFMRQGRLRSK